MWDGHTYENNFWDSPCGMYIPTEMISGIHRVGCTYLWKWLGFDASPDRTWPQPGSQEGLSPMIYESCGKDTLSHTLTWRRFQMSSRKGVKTVCLGPMRTSVSILHHVFLLLFMMFLCIIMLFGVILMPFLS